MLGRVVLQCVLALSPAQLPQPPVPATHNPTELKSVVSENEAGAEKAKVQWKRLLLEAAVFNAFQDVGNSYTGYWYRHPTVSGKWLHRYADSVAGFRFNRWSDDNPMLDDYVGHPMMGSITNFIWIANDPKARTFEFENSRAYWKGRARAFAFSTAYSTLWKIGPFGEAGVGHIGESYFSNDGTSKGVNTNETGFVSLVTTPVGGLAWTVGEDVVDQHVIRRMERISHNPFWLTSISFLNPTRGVSNILRLRAPWYRDTRLVVSSSVWSSPPQIAYAGFGGRNEFGFWAGLSVMSGHVFGYDKDVNFGVWNFRMTHEILSHKHWDLRFAPEITPLAVLTEPQPNPTNDPETYRKRTYGAGLSPVGFEMGFHPHGRFQPVATTNGGFLYFGDRVLSNASRLLFTIDLGTGMRIFLKERRAVTLGYRYHHMSNANIAATNPGTDANLFYVSISIFR